jgi:protein-tyrosine phosphatase
MRILMVCLGNICRSPLAHGIMQHLVNEQGLNWEVDSAGTAGYHIGKSPDNRSIGVAKKYGIDISKQTARKFNAQDFKKFDLIYVMDKNNNVAERSKVKLFLTDVIVEDPYYNDSLFEPLFELLNTQCAKLLEDLRKENT